MHTSSKTAIRSACVECTIGHHSYSAEMRLTVRVCVRVCVCVGALRWLNHAAGVC